jgi:hypothetical protein
LHCFKHPMLARTKLRKRFSPDSPVFTSNPISMKSGNVAPTFNQPARHYCRSIVATYFRISR